MGNPSSEQCLPHPNSHPICTHLRCADKTIKLWKIFEKRVRMVTAKSVDGVREPGASNGGGSAFVEHLRLPTLQPVQNVASATQKRCYPNGHIYHINSLSFNNDGTTFLSADDLRVNVWNMHSNATTFSEPSL